MTLRELAQRVLYEVTAERMRGMQLTGVAINTDDYAGLVLENDSPIEAMFGVPIEHRGRIMPGALILSLAGK